MVLKEPADIYLGGILTNTGRLHPSFRGPCKLTEVAYGDTVPTASVWFGGETYSFPITQVDMDSYGRGEAAAFKETLRGPLDQVVAFLNEAGIPERITELDGLLPDNTPLSWEAINALAQSEDGRSMLAEIDRLVARHKTLNQIPMPETEAT